jgi:hypothetical protein
MPSPLYPRPVDRHSPTRFPKLAVGGVGEGRYRETTRSRPTSVTAVQDDRFAWQHRSAANLLPETDNSEVVGAGSGR